MNKQIKQLESNIATREQKVKELKAKTPGNTTLDWPTPVEQGKGPKTFPAPVLAVVAMAFTALGYYLVM